MEIEKDIISLTTNKSDVNQTQERLFTFDIEIGLYVDLYRTRPRLGSKNESMFQNTQR